MPVLRRGFIFTELSAKARGIGFNFLKKVLFVFLQNILLRYVVLFYVLACWACCIAT